MTNTTFNQRFCFWYTSEFWIYLMYASYNATCKQREFLFREWGDRIKICIRAIQLILSLYLSLSPSLSLYIYIYANIVVFNRQDILGCSDRKLRSGMGPVFDDGLFFSLRTADCNSDMHVDRKQPNWLVDNRSSSWQLKVEAEVWLKRIDVVNLAHNLSINIHLFRKWHTI